MSTNPRSLGKYELQERLGRGGMAEVWKAFDPRLRRYVAIKFMHADLRADPTFVTRFTREAQAIASLRHPNIVQIYDFETSTPASGDPQAYMVMDYVEGQTLADYIRNTSRAGKFLSPTEIVNLFSSISAAIDYAHQRGMIHRDIKPANILLDKHHTARNPMGEPVLSDFGIVKIMDTATGTLTSSSVGTPLYISPEQAKGEPGDERSDIYSLGVVLYEVCTGTPPFRGDNPFVILNQHINTPPPSPALINPNIPPALTEVIMRALAKDPAARFPSASSLASAVAQALNVPVPENLKQPAYSSDVADQATYLKSLQDDPTERTVLSKPVSVENAFPPVLAAETGSTKPVDPITPPALAPESATLQAQTPSALRTSEPPSPPAAPPRRRPRGLLIALIALLILVLVGSGVGAFFLLSPRNQTAGTGFFQSSGQAVGQNSLGIHDEFQIKLSNIPNPPSGKNYYAWLLPDSDQPEASSISLGPLNINNGAATLSSTYMDPQHNNLIGQFSRFLVTEEDTNPPPQSYSLDKSTWRYYAEIPQTPLFKDCIGQLNQLNYLCHLRHLLAKDPKLELVGLHGGLNYWFLNNLEEVQKWAREAVDHSDALSIRHKVIDILYIVDGLQCARQDLQQASTAPGTDNRPDDNTLNKITAVPLFTCALNPAVSDYLLHIHNHLSAMIQSPGALADQVTLGTQINNELNQVKVWLAQVQKDARQLVRMDNTQLTQVNGSALRHDIDTLATRALSGGIDPATGETMAGALRISDQVQQLATFDVMQYTG